MTLKILADYPWEGLNAQVLPVVSLDENGNIVTGGGGGSAAGGESYQSPGDFAAAYASSISLNLSELPFPPLFEQIALVAEYDGDNLIASYSVSDLDLDWTWTPGADASTGVLEVADVANILTILNEAVLNYEAHRVLTTGGVHGAEDSVNAITATFPATTQAEAIALGSDLRTQYEAHRIVVAPAVHGAADATNTIASANPTTWATLVTFVNEFKNTTAFNQHIALTAGGVHGAADSANEVTSPDAGTFDAASTFVVQLRGPERDIIEVLTDFGGPDTYYSPRDFDAVWASATTLTLGGVTPLLFTPAADDIWAVVELVAGGKVRMVYTRKEWAFTWIAAPVGAGTLTIALATMQATSSFIVLLKGPEHITSPANTARAATDWVKQVSHIDAAGTVLMSLATLARGGFVRLSNGTIEALLSAANLARNATDVVLSTQHLDETGAPLKSLASLAQGGFVRLSNGTIEALLSAANLARNATDVVLSTQHLDETGAPLKSLASLAQGGFVRISNGTIEALLSAANLARNATDVVLSTQHLDETGAPLKSLASLAQGGFVRVSNGTIEALLSAANLARNATDVVLSTQPLDATGKVSPAGDTAGNAPFAKPTDGTIDLAFKQADTAPTTSTIVTPTQHVDEEGKVLPAGEDSASAIYMRLLGMMAQMSGPGMYVSPIQFTVAQNAATEIDLSGGFPTITDVSQILLVVQISNAGVVTVFYPHTHAFAWDSVNSRITVTGAVFAGTDVFGVVIRGADRYASAPDNHLLAAITNHPHLDSSDRGVEQITALQAFTNAWADVGSEISTFGCSGIVFFFTLDINDDSNLRFRLLAKHESGGAEEYFLPIKSVSAGVVNVQQHYVEFTEDIDQLIAVAFDLDGLTPIGQPQILRGTDGGGVDAEVDALYYVKGVMV